MKNIYSIILLVLAINFAIAKDPALTENFVLGTPEIKSINAITFGPQGILFLGDSKGASVYAIDTKDVSPIEGMEAVRVNKIDEKIATVLGTTADNISIQDMAVNPLSKVIYMAVHHNNGTPILLKMKGEEISAVSLDQIKYSEVSLEDPVAVDAKDRRGRALRVWAISDIGYHDNKLMVSGLSNKEFSSTFRSIPFPFKSEQEQSSLEIYHAAHGRYETYAPIKAFTTAKLKGESHLVASYTCTPLVVFPMNQIQPGKHTKGRTVAELGNWNTPLDMITMDKEGESYLLMANSNRALMKIKYSDIESFNQSLTEPLAKGTNIAGVNFIALPFVNVTQLAKLDDKRFIFVQRNANGDLNLSIANDRWL